MSEKAKKSKAPPRGLQVTRGGRAAGWKFPLDRYELPLVVKSMLTQAGKGRAFLEITLLDDDEMTEVHRDFLGCDSPTNVLAFPSGTVAPVKNLSNAENKGSFPKTAGPANLGWIAISYDTLLRESFLYGQEPTLYAIRLLAHGIAHLAGYSHGAEMDDFSDKLYEKAVNLLKVERKIS